ncbi:helix-turn-helix domain-containing protein [Streptomyces sp. CT34]|uniref:helix-turn-helix domain-containing protein n=1 Tax=Streptomyces sp. CT34 TaxID=1553907 RepID=UPI0005BD33E5|nr:helix-turn-helix domain-containing protein [Streptomyces sp. CT34]
MTAYDREQRAVEIVALYKGGLPVERLRERFGISTWTLYDLLRRHRVPLRATAYPDSASRRAVAEYGRLRGDGMTHREIAEKFGITPNTLYHALRRHR